jgi:hypothetical protein
MKLKAKDFAHRPIKTLLIVIGRMPPKSLATANSLTTSRALAIFLRIHLAAT